MGEKVGKVASGIATPGDGSTHPAAASVLARRPTAQVVLGILDMPQLRVWVLKFFLGIGISLLTFPKVGGVLETGRASSDGWMCIKSRRLALVPTLRWIGFAGAATFSI